MTNHAKASLKIGLAMVIVGSFIMINKLITVHFPVFLASEIRLLIGAVILVAVVFIKEGRFPSFTRRDLFILFAQSFIGVFLFSLCLLYGLKFTSAVDSGIITSATPAAVGLLSFFLFKEKLNRLELSGIGLTVLGMLIINVFGALSAGSAGGEHSLLGNLLIVGAVIGEAVFVTFGRLVSRQISSLVISAMMSCFGALLFLPMAVYEAGTFQFSSVGAGKWLLLLYAGVVVTALAVLLMNAGVKQVSSGTTAVLTSIMPVSAVVLSCLLLKEPFFTYHAAGIACVFAGIWVMTRKPNYEVNV